jgi:hypothetical protein
MELAPELNEDYYGSMVTQSAPASDEGSDNVVTSEEPKPVLRLEDPMPGEGISETLETTLLSLGVPAVTVESAKTHVLHQSSARERIASRLRRTLSAVAGH